jgi:hypothetical protein
MARPSLARAKLHRDGEAEIGNERKRVRGIDRKRRQHRKDVMQKVVFQPGSLAFRELAALDQHDVFLAQVFAQRAPARLLVGREASDRLADADKLLRRGQPIRTLLDDAFAHLIFQACDAHHEEFIEVVG